MVISSTVSRRKQNINISSKRKKPPAEEKTVRRIERKHGKNLIYQMQDTVQDENVYQDSPVYQSGTVHQRRTLYQERNIYQDDSSKQGHRNKKETYNTGKQYSEDHTSSFVNPTNVNRDNKAKKNNQISDIRQSKSVRNISKIRKNTSRNANNDAGFEGITKNIDDTEYTGRKRRNINRGQEQINSMVKRVATSFATAVLMFVKAAIAALSNIVVVVIAVIATVVITTVIVVQNLTYNMIADEEIHVRDIMSQITYEINTDIRTRQYEEGCDRVAMEGSLADWKEIIAFWWTLKQHVSDTEEWNNYFDGDDYNDLKYIFNQFNEFEYSVNSKNLVVRVTNTSYEDMATHWGLTEQQQEYYYSLLNEEEIWEEILGTTELSYVSRSQLANGADAYIEWSGVDGDHSAIFVSWCLDQIGCIAPGFLDSQSDTQAMMDEFSDKGFLKDTNYQPKEGDIVFLQANDVYYAGIIGRIDYEDLYVVVCDYMEHGTVEELVLTSTSSIIAKYGHINGYTIEALQEKIVKGFEIVGYFQNTYQNIWNDTHTIKESGWCGISTVATALASLGMTDENGNLIDPIDVRTAMGANNTYYNTIGYVISAYNLGDKVNYQPIPEGVDTVDWIKQQLRMGRLVMDCFSCGDMAYYTNTEAITGNHHWILLCGYESDGTIKCWDPGKNKICYLAESELSKSDKVSGRCVYKSGSIGNPVVCSFGLRYSAEDVTLLAATLATEAYPSDIEGMLAVGTVIMNRVDSPAYPDNLKDIIFDQGQFEVTFANENYIHDDKVSIEYAEEKNKGMIRFNNYLDGTAEIPQSAIETAQSVLSGKRNAELVKHQCIGFKTYSKTIEAEQPNGVNIGGNWFFWN